MKLPGRRGANQHTKLPDDHSLVTWTDAASELALSRQSVYRLVHKGSLERHISRRGVTRNSLQDFIGKQIPDRYDRLSVLASRIADLVAGTVKLTVYEREQVAFRVLQELRSV